MNTNDNRLKAHKLIDHTFSGPSSRPRYGAASGADPIESPDAGSHAGREDRLVRCRDGHRQDLRLSGGCHGSVCFPDRADRPPIIISTSSIALQNAVLTEYLPLLSCVLMADGILTKPLKAVIRKGKSHYVLRRAAGQAAASGISCKENPEALTRSGLLGKRWT